MSTGIVVCSKCRREVHQDGPKDKDGRYGWRHCEDKTPKCEGATVDYAERGEPKGRFCGMDGLEF